MARKKLTDIQQISAELSNEDVLHIVDVSDTTQDPAGSSYKVSLEQLNDFLVDIESINWGNIQGNLSNQTDLTEYVSTQLKKQQDGIIDEIFTPTDGQTSFILSNMPTNNSMIFMFVNNATYIVGQDFTISGVTITWLENFPISTGDIVVVRYPT